MTGIRALSIFPPNGFGFIVQIKILENYEWYKDIIFYLKYGQFPLKISSKERRKLEMKETHYVLVSRVLFRWNFDGVLLICMDHSKSKEVIQ